MSGGKRRKMKYYLIFAKRDGSVTEVERQALVMHAKEKIFEHARNAGVAINGEAPAAALVQQPAPAQQPAVAQTPSPAPAKSESASNPAPTPTPASPAQSGPATPATAASSANADQPVTESTPLATGDSVRVQRGRDFEDAVPFTAWRTGCRRAGRPA